MCYNSLYRHGLGSSNKMILCREFMVGGNKQDNFMNSS